MKRFLWLLWSILGVAAATAVLAADSVPVFPGDPAKGQQIVSQVCSACHNADGNSTVVTNPKLAGQHPEYLVKQMKNFKAEGSKPAERTNPIMNAMIAAYSEEQMQDIAAYLSAQARKSEVAKNYETVEFGRKIFRSGDLAKGLPACASCHGPTGAGMPAQYPRLSGQFPEYTEAQLRSFRAGERSNDSNKMMRMVTIKMTDPEIKAVADFIAGLR